MLTHFVVCTQFDLIEIAYQIKWNKEKKVAANRFSYFGHRFFFWGRCYQSSSFIFFLLNICVQYAIHMFVFLETRKSPKQKHIDL